MRRVLLSVFFMVSSALNAQEFFEVNDQTDLKYLAEGSTISFAKPVDLLPGTATYEMKPMNGISTSFECMLEYEESDQTRRVPADLPFSVKAVSMPDITYFISLKSPEGFLMEMHCSIDPHQTLMTIGDLKNFVNVNPILIIE